MHLLLGCSLRASSFSLTERHKRSPDRPTIVSLYGHGTATGRFSAGHHGSTCTCYPLICYVVRASKCLGMYSRLELATRAGLCPDHTARCLGCLRVNVSGLKGVEQMQCVAGCMETAMIRFSRKGKSVSGKSQSQVGKLCHQLCMARDISRDLANTLSAGKGA